MPTCNDFQGMKGCGQEIQWIPNPAKPGKKMKANLDGSKHVCGSGTGLTGYEEAQVHTKAERYLGNLATNALETPLENIHLMLRNIEDQNTTINTNQMDILNAFKNLQTNVTDLVKGLKIKGKVDYSKDDDAPNLEEMIKKNTKDLAGIGENLYTIVGLVKAALEKGGMMSASEMYKMEQEIKEEQPKIDNPLC